MLSVACLEKASNTHPFSGFTTFRPSSGIVFDSSAPSCRGRRCGGALWRRRRPIKDATSARGDSLAARRARVSKLRSRLRALKHAKRVACAQTCRGRRCGGSLWCDSRQSERERAHRSYTPKRASCEAGCERSTKDSSCPSTHHQSPPDSQTQAAIPTAIHARDASSAPPAHPLLARSKAPSCRLRDRGSAQE